MISGFSGSELALDLDDVENHIRVPPSHLSDSAFLAENGLSSSRLFNADSEISSSSTDIKVLSALARAGTPLSSTPPDGTEYTSYQILLRHCRIRGTPRRRFWNYRASLVPVPLYSSGGANDVPPSLKEEEVPIKNPYAMPRTRPRSRLSRPSARHPRRDTISSVRSSLYDAADRA